MFTTASKGPAGPLYPEIFLSKASSYRSRTTPNSVRILSGRIESESSLADKECCWGVEGEAGGGLEGGSQLSLTGFGMYVGTA